MNILTRELKAGRKPFLFWMLGMFVLDFVGIMKYQGVASDTAGMMQLLSSFPKIILSVMGVANVDVTRLSGYTAVLAYYVIICAVIYAVHLGSSAVTRELTDKTYEFLFTKPCSRSRALWMKLLAAWIYLALFVVFYIVFSLLAVTTIKTSESIVSVTLLFALDTFLVGSLFLALSALLAAVAGRPEKGSLYGNLAFLYAFLAGFAYDALENAGALRLISPLRYFLPPDLIAGRFSVPYALLTLALVAACLFGAFRRFQRRDLLG